MALRRDWPYSLSAIGRWNAQSVRDGTAPPGSGLGGRLRKSLKLLDFMFHFM